MNSPASLGLQLPSSLAGRSCAPAWSGFPRSCCASAYFLTWKWKWDSHKPQSSTEQTLGTAWPFSVPVTSPLSSPFSRGGVTPSNWAPQREAGHR